MDLLSRLKKKKIINKIGMERLFGKEMILDFFQLIERFDCHKEFQL